MNPLLDAPTAESLRPRLPRNSPSAAARPERTPTLHTELARTAGNYVVRPLCQSDRLRIAATCPAPGPGDRTPRQRSECTMRIHYLSVSTQSTRRRRHVPAPVSDFPSGGLCASRPSDTDSSHPCYTVPSPCVRGWLRPVGTGWPPPGGGRGERAASGGHPAVHPSPDTGTAVPDHARPRPGRASLRAAATGGSAAAPIRCTRLRDGHARLPRPDRGPHPPTRTRLDRRASAHRQ